MVKIFPQLLRPLHFSFVFSAHNRLLSHNLIFLLPKTRMFSSLIGSFSFSSIFLGQNVSSENRLFLLMFFQVFKLAGKASCDTIAILEGEVFKLQWLVHEGKKFDIALTTGSGRGRPKADAFVSHARCLLVTGLVLCCVVWFSFVVLCFFLSALDLCFPVYFCCMGV